MGLPEGIAPLTPGAWAETPILDAFVELAAPLYKIDFPEPLEPMRFGFQVLEKHCNRLGWCHGGMLATFLDFSLGFVGKAACGDVEPTPTISLSMDFLQPAALGDWIETRARLVHHTKRLFFSEGTLVTHKGAIIRANALYRRASK
jgi:uncharacterized protein (TIGR00369 family)